MPKQNPVIINIKVNDLESESHAMMIENNPSIHWLRAGHSLMTDQVTSKTV